MEFSPSEIRRKTFQLMRRGFDPQEVGAYLEQLSAQVADLQKRLDAAETSSVQMEKELTEARSAEEAVRLTMLAATSAKEEILAGANKEAAELRRTSTLEAEKLKESTQEEADRVLGEARREALRLLEASRKDAEEMVDESRAEHEGLIAEVASIRSAVAQARQSLASIAGDGVSRLSAVDESLTDIHAASAAVRDDMTDVLDDAPHPAVASPAGKPQLGLVPTEEGAAESPAIRAAIGHDSDTDSGTEATLFPPLDDDFAHVGHMTDASDLYERSGAGGAAEDQDAVEIGGEVVLLPDAVDRLLSRLRDING